MIRVPPAGQCRRLDAPAGIIIFREDNSLRGARFIKHAADVGDCSEEENSREREESFPEEVFQIDCNTACPVQPEWAI